MAAKGCHGRGGNARGKEYEAKRHGGGGSKGRARRREAARIERAHETAERRAAKAAIQEGLQDVE